MQTPKILPPHYFLLSLALMLVVVLVGGRGFFDHALIYAGLIPMIGGGALAVLASRQFSAAGTNIIPLSKSTALVIDGVYRWTRNPMYTGMILFLTGLALVLDNPWNWLAVSAFVLIIRQSFVLREELLMTETFAERYTNYKSTVRRWI